MKILGRTNLEFPDVWLQLGVPNRPEDIPAFVEAAVGSGLPLEVTSQPGLWGGYLRGHSPFLAATGSLNYTTGSDTAHASDLVQSELIHLLSSLGRETIDAYFLPVRESAEEFQVNGALEALEAARQEGHIRFVGLHAVGHPLSALGLWQFHDGFELVRYRRNHVYTEAHETLEPMAAARRVGIVTDGPFAWRVGQDFLTFPEDADAGAPMTDRQRMRNLIQGKTGRSLRELVVCDLVTDNPVLFPVRSLADVRSAVAASVGKPIDGLSAYLAPFLEAA